MSENKEPDSFKDIVSQLYACLKAAKKDETIAMLGRLKNSSSKIYDRIDQLKKYFSSSLESKHIDEIMELTKNISYLVKLEKDINRKLQEFSQTE